MKITIEKLIFEGFGLGRTNDGKPVFVRKSVPGDEVEVSITKDKKSYSEGIIKKIIQPSSNRITPQCKVFYECGGCEHMNISYENQLRWKEKIFIETLLRQGITTQPEKIIPGSDSEFFYRNSIRFFFVLNEDNSISFARHNYEYNKGLVKTNKCFLQSEISNQILEALEDFINKNIELKGSFWQLKIREGKSTHEFMVEIITQNEDLPEQKGIVETLKNIDGVKSVYHTIAPSKSLKQLKRRLIFGSPIIHEKIGKFTFQISPESFFQTNSLGIKTLYDKIKEFASVSFGDNILDLYCGTGTIGIYLSTLAKKVVGIEIVPEAVRDARDNAQLNHISNCEFISEDVGKYLDKHRNSFDITIVDPPRAGLSIEIIQKLCKLKLKKIIYISCNPATFARDIIEFEKNNLSLKKVQAVDMFPQTHHIECVGIIE